MSLSHTRLVWIAALPALFGCQTDYVGRLGLEGGDAKEELADVVADARSAQVRAQDEFQEAYELFERLTVASPDVELEPLYDDFQGELEDCVVAAQRLQAEIGSIETHAGHLFTEWEAGLALYANPKLREKSAARLVETRERVVELVQDLTATLEAMQPVLSNYGDYALFFHHNLNVPAIGTLKDTLPAFVQLNATLIGEIESDVARADEFDRFLAGNAADELDTVVVRP